MEKNKATSPEKKAALEAIRDEFKGTASGSQAARLLEALSRFPVTTYEAMRTLTFPLPGAYIRATQAGAQHHDALANCRH